MCNETKSKYFPLYYVGPPNMIEIVSFDVNKASTEVDEIKRGVYGGSILRV